MSTETIKSKAYRILVGNGLWDRISFWSKAADTEAADGKNLETKVGAVDGITSDITSTSQNYAASIKTVHDLNSNLTANNQPFRFGYEDGKYGYITKEADTDVFVPFSASSPWEVIAETYGTFNVSKGTYIIIQGGVSGSYPIPSSSGGTQIVTFDAFNNSRGYRVTILNFTSNGTIVIPSGAPFNVILKTDIDTSSTITREASYTNVDAGIFTYYSITEDAEYLVYCGAKSGAYAFADVPNGEKILSYRNTSAFSVKYVKASSGAICLGGTSEASGFAGTSAFVLKIKSN